MRALRAMFEVYVDMEICACSAMHRGYKSRGQSDILPMGHEQCAHVPGYCTEDMGWAWTFVVFRSCWWHACCVRLCDPLLTLLPVPFLAVKKSGSLE